MSFGPNEQDHGHIHAIVQDNVPIFGKYMYFRMVNDSAKVSFQIIYQNIIFRFLGAKMSFL